MFDTFAWEFDYAEEELVHYSFSAKSDRFQVLPKG